MSNLESSNQVVMNNGYIQPLGKIINIMVNELKSRNLEYMELQNLRVPDKNRIVFDILTIDLNNGRKCIVHVDFIQAFPTVEQFLDCVYGSGSTSDLKIIIYDDHYPHIYNGPREESAFYFVNRMIEKCNAVNIPFELIRYHNPSDRTDLSWFFFSPENRQSVKAHLQSGPLPTKRDILGLAFWALFFTIYRDEENFELHQLHSDRSFDICISGDLCVFVKWTDEGICYVISDCHRSEFISWLWNRRKEYLEKKYPGLKLSAYRDGKHSYIGVHVNNIPFHELRKMRYSERERLADRLFHGKDIDLYNIEETVRKIQKQYKIEIEQTNDNLTQ